MDLLTALTAWGQVGQVYTKPAKFLFPPFFVNHLLLAQAGGVHTYTLLCPFCHGSINPF